MTLLEEFLNIHKITEEQYYKHETSHKWCYRYYCFQQIHNIRKPSLPDIQLNSKYETCLIEFRIFPHLEFIIRNAIIKLGPTWSHTVICGTSNYDYMRKMCNDIHPNIKVIQLPYDNLEPRSGYSDLLTSMNFWNLFVGEKILIHQEDSCIFETNIEEFLQYDYIGAPWDYFLNSSWLKNSNIIIPVGNGGFSLRTKQIMIDVINKASTRGKYESEDVYFSKNMQIFNIGKLPNPEIAFEFSTEQLVNKNSFGGHDFSKYECDWISRCNKKCIDCYNINILSENT